MKYIQGNNRTQTYLFPVSLEDSIDQENEVRLIDLFVDSLSLKDYGFKVAFVENGRPAYRPADLLKLYIYGYMNKVRTSRDLEKECKRKAGYKKIEKQLNDTGEPQVSTSDPDSRQMIIRNNITEVAYNVQTSVDSKNNIPIDYKVTNQNDSKAMGNMLQRDKSILRANNFTALYDKGYHTGSEFDIAEKLDVNVMVAIPGKPASSQAPDPNYNVENFIYNENENTYTCPQGHFLTTNGTWHKTTNGSIFQQCKTTKCKACPVRENCTKAKQNGKIVQRRKYASNIEANRQRIENDPAIYKKQQTIVEHPYGTIKRQWGFSYIMTKKYIHRASADVGLIMTAYNLRRIINILGINVLQEYLQMILNTFFYIFGVIQLKKKFFAALKIFITDLPIRNKNGCNEFILSQNLAFS